MGWLKLDDKFRGHPKIGPLSDAAFRLHLHGMGYCAEYETDGVIALGVVEGLTRHRNKAVLVDELLSRGNWEPVEGGYSVHDFLDWNPSKAEQEAKRQQARERMNNARSSQDVRANKSRSAREVRSTPTRPDPLRLAAQDSPRTPPGGGDAGSLERPPTRKQRKAAALDAQRVDAVAVLDALNAARLRAIPGAKALRPTTENLALISDRLAAGATVDECRHVVAVREAEVCADTDGNAAQWFNAVTPFRPENFALSLSQPPPDPPRRQHTAEEIAAAEAEADRRGLESLRRLHGEA